MSLLDGKIKKKEIIIIAATILLAGIFLDVSINKRENILQEITKSYKIEKIKNLEVGEVNESDANFILANFSKLKSNGDLKNITKKDLEKINIRDAKISDLPAIVDIHNRGLNEGVWCPLPYKTSAWTVIKEYQNWTKRYGKENIYIRVAEIDGKIAAVMAGADYEGKAINLFTFMNVDVPKRYWSETMIKIALNFFELARSLNLDIVEARIAKGVWLEGFMRDVIKAESLPDGIWHINRDYNLSRTWTEEDYNYDNNSFSGRENRNNKAENLTTEQSFVEKGAKILSQTEISDTYRRKDGTREMLIYPSPVNIKIDGKWWKIRDYLKQPEEIQETKLEAGKKYQMSPFDIYAGADDGGKNIIFYDKGADFISFSLENMKYKDENRELVLSEAMIGNIASSYKSIFFRDIFEGVDLKYHSTANGMKEEIIFSNSDIFKEVENPDYFSGKIILRTKISVSDGIVSELHNSQLYFKRDGKIFFSTSQPFIYDQEKRTSMIDSELKKEEGDYYLETALDYGWMTSEEKIYPLILDPDLNINPAADVSLCADSLCTTDTRDTPANIGIGRTFIKFDISSIPAGSTIQSANVILTHSATNWGIAINARRFIDQIWTESSTVSTFTGSNYGDILSTVTTATGNATETWNVTGSSTDGLKKDYGDGNMYFTVFLNNTLTPPTYTYVNNGTSLILYYSYNKYGSPAQVYDLFHSREGTSPPVLRVTYTAGPVCGDGVCDGTETHATCPVDCPLTSNDANSTIMDYTNHPAEAKTVVGNPGLGSVIFRKQ